MEVGTDINKLYAGNAAIDVNLEYKGEIWKFTFKDLCWKERTNLVKEMFSIGSGGAQKIDVVKLMDMVCGQGYMLSAPDGFNYRKMSPEFGDLLFKNLPFLKSGMSVEDITEDEQKN